MCGLGGPATVFPSVTCPVRFLRSVRHLERPPFMRPTSPRQGQNKNEPKEVCPEVMLAKVLIGVITAVIALVIGLFSGFQYRRNVAEKEIGSAEEAPVPAPGAGAAAPAEGRVSGAEDRERRAQGGVLRSPAGRSGGVPEGSQPHPAGTDGNSGTDLRLHCRGG